MTYYFFKLNVQPNVLLKYKKNDSFQYLLEVAIPQAFESVLEVQEHNSIFKLIAEQNDDDFDELFEDLESKTNKLCELYQEVLQNFRKKHNIHYSQKFLDLNERCMQARRSLEYKFPGIVKAFEVITDEAIDDIIGLEFDGKVGTGITHLRKFYKIKLYLETHTEDNILNSLNLEAYYNPKTEHILVNATTETAALNYVTALVRLINSNESANQHIGKININPIYESITLNDEYTEITYVIVYPNGNPPMDRYNFLKETEAKQVETKLVGSDGKALRSEPIQDIVDTEGKKGYLKSLFAKGKQVFMKIKSAKEIDENS